jgi:sulfide:quinone oxidoreductase
VAHVLILGGGFGGLAAAHELRGSLEDSDRITLVDRGDRFFMGFAKLWDLARVRPLAEGSVALSRLSERGVEFVQTEIHSIDPEHRVVETAAGRFLPDAILVALGAGPAPAHRQLLAAAGGHDLYDATALPAIHQALDSISSGRVVVAILGMPIKCPPAPYEAAFIVAERLRARGVRDDVQVAVATPQPATLPVAGPDASRYVAQRLEEHGIEFLPGHQVTGGEAAAGGFVTFQTGDQLDCSLLLGVPACALPPVLAGSPLVGDAGWLAPDPRTMRTRFANVFAVGDCTVVPTASGQLPKAGVFAAAEGRVAARNMLADLRGGEEAVFDGYGFCFLELPGRQVAFVEGHFLADPPDVRLTEPSEARFREKQEYERDRLATWLG